MPLLRCNVYMYGYFVAGPLACMVLLYGVALVQVTCWLQAAMLLGSSDAWILP